MENLGLMLNQLVKNAASRIKKAEKRQKYINISSLEDCDYQFIPPLDAHQDTLDKHGLDDSEWKDLYASLDKKDPITASISRAVSTGEYKGKKVVVKLCNRVSLDDFAVDPCVEEACILSKIEHRNIIDLVGVYYIDERDPPLSVLITPLIKKGNLNNVLKTEEVSFERKMSWMKQLCSVLLYLSDPKIDIVHCDIKTGNILIDEKDKIKLCDFELARPGTNKLSNSCLKGMPTVSAPEIINDKEPTHATDVWCFGIVLWRVIHDGEDPFDKVSLAEARHAIISSKVYDILTSVTSSTAPLHIQKIVHMCTYSCPSKRIVPAEIKKKLSVKPLQSDKNGV